MSGIPSHIPTEVYLDFLGTTIPIHWNYHAILMVGVWFVLVPLCVMSIRFGKPKPTFDGLKIQIKLTHLEWWWFSVHKVGLYLAIFLVLGGAVVALTVSKGFSGSTHSIFGLATILMGCLQVFSSWLRGKHGGRYYFTADPNNPDTWRGDHYDMTPRRKRFEAYHKTAGYFTLACAAGAVGSGLMQFPMPGLALFFAISIITIFVVVVFLEYKGYRHDGYRAAFGYDPEHPYNKARKNL